MTLVKFWCTAKILTHCEIFDALQKFCHALKNMSTTQILTYRQNSCAWWNFLPLAARRAARGRGSTPAFCCHLSPDQREALCRHAFPERSPEAFLHRVFEVSSLLLFWTYLFIDCSTSFFGELGDERRRLCWTYPLLSGLEGRDCRSWRTGTQEPDHQPPQKRTPWWKPGWASVMQTHQSRWTRQYLIFTFFF